MPSRPVAFEFMKYSILLLLSVFTALAQLPAVSDVRIVENTGDYGNIPAIWGTPGHIDDRFSVRPVPTSSVHSNKASGFSYRTVNGQAVSRIMSVPVNIVNVGTRALNFGNTFSSPQNYRFYTQEAPAVSNLFTLRFYETNGVSLVEEMQMDGILPWLNYPAIPGTPQCLEFGPWWQGLCAGEGTFVGEGEQWLYRVDTSNLMDGEYILEISVRGGNSTRRRVLIDVYEVKVIW